MKINQVAELVDITKKNIRFYEDQGLVDPERDPQNGYREYSMDDVRQLERVKLLRQLGVSCENIRRMNSGELSLGKCMRERLRELNESSVNIAQTKSMCELLADENIDLSSLDASLYLEKIKEIERGGVRFMNVKGSDVKKRKTGAVIAAAAVLVFMVLMIAMLIWPNNDDPAPPGVLAVVIVIFGGIIVGVLIALRQRLKEVEKGELDEADKY